MLLILWDKVQQTKSLAAAAVVAADEDDNGDNDNYAHSTTIHKSPPSERLRQNPNGNVSPRRIILW